MTQKSLISQQQLSFFFFLNFHSLKIEQDGISAIQFEAAQMQFLSEVLIAITIVVT